MNAATRKIFDTAVAYKQQGELQRSRDLLQDLARQNPETASILAVLGDVYWDLGQLEAAVDSFRSATLIKPFSETVSLALFHCLRKLERRDEALKEAQRYLTHSDSSDYLEMIQEMHHKWVMGDADTDKAT